MAVPIQLQGAIAVMPYTTLRDKGRVVIPRELRQKFGLKIGDKFEVKEDNGQIVLVPKNTHEAWNWTKRWQKKIDAALKDVEEGRVSKAYNNLEEALEDLKKKV